MTSDVTTFGCHVKFGSNNKKAGVFSRHVRVCDDELCASGLSRIHIATSLTPMATEVEEESITEKYNWTMHD